MRTSLLTDQAQALNRLLQTRKQIEPETSLEDAVDILADAIQEISQFGVVMVYSYDRQFQLLKPVALKGFKPADAEVVAEIFHPWENVVELTKPEFKRSRAYYVPHEHTAKTFLFCA